MTRRRPQPPPDAAIQPPDGAINFRDRIVELRRVKASELRRNKNNWRLHPESQKGAFRGMLADVGFVGAILARVKDDHYEILDGHMRSDEVGDAEVPVLLTDLNDEEAAKILATYDPLSAMALQDDGQLEKLLGQINSDDNAELRRMLADLHDKLATEVEKSGDDKREVRGMALQPHEHYDYLVVLASTTQEWNVLCGRLGLEPAIRRGGIGTARAIRASQLLPKLTA